MNYRHAFHAGNFADVFKHTVMARILVHLAEKPQPFRVIDTHAGAGLYDLAGASANRTGEWREGIGRLTPGALAPFQRALIAPYLDAVAAQNSSGALRFYPGSPLLALKLMRPHDRLIACEIEPRAAAKLARHLHGDKRAKAVAIDGWVALKAYVPPKERRGLVLIDPPFEDEDEFSRLTKGLEDAHRKWPTGVYLLWYPVKDSAPAALARRLGRSGIGKILRAELHLFPPHPTRLNGAGLIIVNPPWRLAGEIETLLPALAAALARGAPSRIVLDRLTDQL